MIAPDGKLSISRQCKLVSLNRSSLYYKSMPLNGENIELMKRIDA